MYTKVHVSVCMCIYFIGPFFSRQERHPVKVNQQGAGNCLLFGNHVIGQLIASTNQLSSCPESPGVDLTWPHPIPSDLIFSCEKQTLQRTKNRKLRADWSPLRQQSELSLWLTGALFRPIKCCLGEKYQNKQNKKKDAKNSLLYFSLLNVLQVGGA